jgi:hypothetical protein
MITFPWVGIWRRLRPKLRHELMSGAGEVGVDRRFVHMIYMTGVNADNSLTSAIQIRKVVMAVFLLFQTVPTLG